MWGSVCFCLNYGVKSELFFNMNMVNPYVIHLFLCWTKYLKNEGDKVFLILVVVELYFSCIIECCNDPRQMISSWVLIIIIRNIIRIIWIII